MLIQIIFAVLVAFAVGFGGYVVVYGFKNRKTLRNTIAKRRQEMRMNYMDRQER